MLCERCHGREAVVHITRIINGHKTDEYLCRECAAEEHSKAVHLNLFNHNFFNDSFDSFLDDGFMRSFLGGPVAAVESLCSPKHRVRSFEPERTGLFGKPGSYENLMRHLKFPEEKKSVERKTENLKDSNDKLSSLRKKLNQLVAEERYEEAAKVRDEIRKLEM